MESIRGYLDVGSLYRLHDHDGDRTNEPCLECIKCITDDAYDRHAALVRSTISGWTMVVHGTNIYEDGSIDWDFSTGGHWTTKDENGILHERKLGIL